MDFYKEGKAAAKDAMKQKDVTICEVSSMGPTVAKSLKLKGTDKSDFTSGWKDEMASASRRRRNPMAMGCPSCMRKYRRLRKR